MAAQRRPLVATSDWLLEQQMRAEVEAEAWRRLREQIDRPPPPEVLPPPPAEEAAPARDPHRTGSTILKALVRFGLGAFGAFLAFIAAADAQFGEFEIWLAVGSAFLVTLAASAFEPLRSFVHFLAETARWVLIVAVGFGALWLFTHGGLERLGA
ncbi:MAG: hypothetical protein R3C16_02580 [Hyphomonadaceae bacterium]